MVRTAKKTTGGIAPHALRRIIVATINGNPQVSIHAPDLPPYVIGANHPVHNAFEAQATQEIDSLLFGSLSKIQRERKVEARDDSHRARVSSFSLKVLFSVTSFGNAIRNDLQHPNEYIRGAILRFLQKVSKDVGLLEPLIPTLRANLEHRHSYVRKAAVFALYTVHREHESLVPDAAKLMQTFLAAESDATCKRNAFVPLAGVAMNKAVG
ncbi:adaptin N terminal region-domain-containing protein [Lanmaoa asiatica]|nr:adaptin N terminal region-domain-containing protein [Lanmaoa asiatica]